MRYCYTLILLLALLCSCRHDVIIYPPEIDPVEDSVRVDSIVGFYLLNEGNMGSNKSTLDYYDYTTATYTRNIYGNANPSVPKELGDVGNDLAIYGSQLWAVINCSNKVEVMDAATCQRRGQVDIPNCRYIAFDGPYAYVTSYAGPVQINPDYEQKGFVARIDTATLRIVDTCVVGFQPDGLAIANGNIYVANSGGYMVPNYENTLSVIDIKSFTVQGTIPVAINLHRIQRDRYGKLWITSRGDYYGTSASLYCMDLSSGNSTPQQVVREDGSSIAVSDMTIVGDSLYYVGTEFSYISMDNIVTYGIIDIRTRQMVTDRFITDGTDANIAIPYGIAVNPLSHQIYVTDARNYVNPGYLYCFSPKGEMQWRVRTGDIPAHFAFRYFN